MYVKSSFAFMNYGLLSETRNRTRPITSFSGGRFIIQSAADLLSDPYDGFQKTVPEPDWR